ncbi:hypothetical protein FLAN108750_13605 [Flavobacterium antarcticum]|uniref:hypothetical protein n=1 Tax=Flavobacterium antarcticum TaxID=271155 RepID=UPI0003B74E62|nr:hypothetical protein [Flavobacterium antarcticum]
MQYLKLTPILIVFGIIEIILLIFAFNYLFIDNKGGMALAGTLAFIGAVGNIVILSVEQIIANNVANSKLLWLVEIILIVLIALYISINGITFWQ